MSSIAARLAALVLLAFSGAAHAAEQVQVVPGDQPAPKAEVPNSAIIPQIRKLNSAPPDAASNPPPDAATPAADAPATPPPAAAPAASTRSVSAPAAKPASDTAAKSATDGDKAVAKTLAPPPKPKATVVISVNLTKQNMTVSEDGEQKYSWAVSSGRANGYQTPTGTFRPQWMAKMWHSRKYDDAPMPNSIFFTGGFAIHATAAYSQLGRPASHGCVRLSPTNAAMLFKMVQRHGMDATKIVVHGTTPSEPEVARYTSRNAPRLATGMPPARYVVQRSNSPLDALFGSEPRRIVYGTPAPSVRRGLPPGYVVTSSGTVLRVR